MNSVEVPLLERLTSSVGATDTDRRSPGMARRDLHGVLCRELAVLFNASGLGMTQGLSAFPQVRRSVLNYGLGSLAGVARTSISTHALVSRIRQVVLNFEPRIQRYSLEVSLISASTSAGELQFRIQGEFYHANSLRPFSLKSAWNTESGEVRVQAAGDLVRG